MNVSGVSAASAASSTPYADTLRAALAAKAKAAASAGSVDADGDHDGTKPGQVDAPGK